ncbi:hypothetical protein [Pseudonocardia broussonetiae]|uniref:Uncharacterized protein n=1 Tax=Pseudonocardia broussonetiae TaxID=2736640 RepID=A0A6M6JK00_9PSEU|nr:hypothetical protein [Pseudonocardia broussonetiae]QJY46671.1 hypothetical protein HOP40_13280 [Pseudonocardia broussonetiae]
MTAHVLGLDLALANSGAAAITTDGHVTTWVKTTDALPADAAILDVDARISDVARWAVGLCTTGTKLVAIEGPSHGSQHGQPHERAGLWWRVIRGLIARELPVAVLSPSTVKGYIAGKGNADKALVQYAVDAAWPGRGLKRKTSHECDAVALATAGVDWCGWPGPFLEGRRGAAWLLKGQWPERESVSA